MIYLDTSAAIKLAVAEDESGALVAFLDSAAGQSIATSTLGLAELRRAALRLGPNASEAARAVAEQLDILELPAEALDLAGTIPPSGLRTLDAIHVATALVYQATMVVTYDQRMLQACAEHGIDTISPSGA